MARLLKKLKKIWERKGNYYDVIVGSGGTVALRAIKVGSKFLVSILLARTLGTEEYGVYRYVISWMTMLAMVGKAGIPQLATREVSKASKSSNWGYLKGFIKWSTISVIMLSLVASLAYVLVFYSARSIFEGRKLLVVPIVGLTLTALLGLKQGVIRGTKYVLGAQIPRSVIFPVSFLLCTYIASIHLDLSSEIVITVYVSCLLLSLIFIILIQGYTIGGRRRNQKSIYNIYSWLKSSVPFFLSSIGNKINKEVPIIILGSFIGAKEAGLFAISRKGASVIKLVLMSVNMPVGPIFSRLYVSKKVEELQKVVTKSARLIFYTSLPIFILLIAFGSYFLSLFGSEYVDGYSILVVLSLGQLFNSSMGSVGILLNMTNLEKYTAYGVIISSLLNTLLCFMLVPYFEGLGAAVSVSISILVWNIALTYFCFKNLNINATFV